MSRESLRDILPVVFNTIKEYKDKGLQMVVINIEGYFNDATLRADVSPQSIEVWNAKEGYLPVFNYGYNLITLLKSMRKRDSSDTRKVIMHIDNKNVALVTDYPNIFSFVFDKEHIIDVSHHILREYTPKSQPINLEILQGYPGNATRGYVVLVDDSHLVRDACIQAINFTADSMKDLGIPITYKWHYLEGYDFSVEITSDSEDGLDEFESRLRDFLGISRMRHQADELFSKFYRMDLETMQMEEPLWN